jgi:hypothetical protein
MRKIIAVVLFLLFLPAVSLGDYHGYRYGPAHSYYRPRYGQYYSGHHHHHGDEWVVPLVIAGGLLGAMALSQMPPASYPPPPPQRICRDTYDYYDEYGQYLYSRYVDRPCY